jgi:hypothetical protein
MSLLAPEFYLLSPTLREHHSYFNTHYTASSSYLSAFKTIPAEEVVLLPIKN